MAVAPVSIAASMYRKRKVDVHTVLGAICIYVFIGMFFAFVFTAIGELGTEPFFVQMTNATTADYLYFSFVTLTTVGLRRPHRRERHRARRPRCSTRSWARSTSSPSWRCSSRNSAARRRPDDDG